MMMVDLICWFVFVGRGKLNMVIDWKLTLKLLYIFVPSVMCLSAFCLLEGKIQIHHLLKHHFTLLAIMQCYHSSILS